MHKLTIKQRKAPGTVKAKGEAGESTSRDEDLVFLVGPRAASFAIDRPVHSRAVLQKMSAAR